MCPGREGGVPHSHTSAFGRRLGRGRPMAGGLCTERAGPLWRRRWRVRGTCSWERGGAGRQPRRRCRASRVPGPAAAEGGWRGRARRGGRRWTSLSAAASTWTGGARGTTSRRAAATARTWTRAARGKGLRDPSPAGPPASFSTAWLPDAFPAGALGVPSPRVKPRGQPLPLANSRCPSRTAVAR